MGRFALRDRIALHEMFLNDLGDAVVEHTPVDQRPLGVHLCKPFDINLEIHMFPNNYSKTRNSCEYKFCISLQGQKQGDVASFPCVYGAPLLISYSKDYGIYVIYDAIKHSEFTAFSNIQCPVQLLLDAFSNKIATATKKNNEILIGVTRDNLIEGIRKRFILL